MKTPRPSGPKGSAVPSGQQPKTIPTYDSEGHRYRSFSVEACLHFETLSLAVLRRNRYGIITRAQFRTPDGGNPLRGTVRPGQRYSFQAPGHWWQFAEFARIDGLDERELEQFLREVFGATWLSCLVAPAPVPHRRAEVVCISSRRPLRESPLLAA